MRITDFLNDLITFPADLQFVVVLAAVVIVIISVSLFYSLVIGIISSLFNRR